MKVGCFSATYGFQFGDVEVGNMFESEGKIYTRLDDNGDSNASLVDNGELFWFGHYDPVSRVNTITLSS